MTSRLRLQEPREFGDHLIIPVVSEISACNNHGMMGSLLPVALLIGYNGEWGIALLEGDSVAELLEHLVLPS